MKKIKLLFVILIFPITGFCQGNTDVEKEKAAIKAVIEKETNAYINLDIESWRSCYLQEEPYARLVTGPDGWAGVNNWASHDSSMYAGFQNYSGEIPLPIKFENENYLIRLTPETAWVVYIENWFDNNGTKTGWNVNTRFLEKENGEWKISYVGVHDVGSYKQATATEN